MVELNELPEDVFVHKRDQMVQIAQIILAMLAGSRGSWPLWTSPKAYWKGGDALRDNEEQRAQEIVASLGRLASCAEEDLQLFSDWLADVGHQNGWEATIGNTGEPGWCLATLTWYSRELMVAMLMFQDPRGPRHCLDVLRNALQSVDVPLIKIRLDREARLLSDIGRASSGEGSVSGPPPELMLDVPACLLRRPDVRQPLNLGSPERADFLLALASRYPRPITSKEYADAVGSDARGIAKRLREFDALTEFLGGFELIDSSSKGSRLTMSVAVNPPTPWP